MKNKKRAAALPLPILVLVVIAVIFFAADQALPDSPPDKPDDPVVEQQQGVVEDEQHEQDEEHVSDNEAHSLFFVPDPDDLAGPYDIDYVVDGDTFYLCNDAGAREKIRLIGVDTPESVHADESKNVEEGKVASNYTKELLEGAGEAYFTFDAQIQDDYGRTLAYAYIATDDGFVMVQDLLLYEGMARTMTIQPNTQHAAHFIEVQRDAQANGRGFWGDYSSLFVENEG